MIKVPTEIIAANLNVLVYKQKFSIQGKNIHLQFDLLKILSLPESLL